MNNVKVSILILGILFINVNPAHSDSFTIEADGEKVKTEFELVFLAGQTYAKTKADGVFLGFARELAPILTPTTFKQAKDAKPGKVTGVAATVKKTPSGFRAVAGPKGMHIYVDLLSGNMDWGQGIKYDVLVLGREVIMQAGDFKLTRFENGKETGVDVYTCEKGARIGPSDAKGQLSIVGIRHKFVPKEEREK